MTAPDGKGVQRPDPGWEPREGYVHAIEPDPKYRLMDADENYQCRWRHAGVRCEFPAQVAINRGTRRGGSIVWHPHCAEHLYGRWIEDGQVMCWVVVPAPTPLSGSQVADGGS